MVFGCLDLCRNEVRYGMRDAFIESRKAPTARRSEIGKINVGTLARRSDHRAIERAAVTWNEKRRFVTKKFGEHGAGIAHSRTKCAGDTQET